MQTSVQSTCGPTMAPEADTHMADASARLPTPKQAEQVQKAVDYAFSAAQHLNMPMIPIVTTSASWRCMHGSLIPPTAEPQMLIANDNCCNICVQWPTVIHATAYVVELLDQTTMTAQRFMIVSEGSLNHLTDLRLDGLQHGAFAACVRCVAPCGCESAPSPWSFLPASIAPGPLVPLAASLVLPAVVPAIVPGAAPQLLGLCPPPPSAPPCLPGALPTVLPALTATATLPAIAEDTPVCDASDDILCLD